MKTTIKLTAAAAAAAATLALAPTARAQDFPQRPVTVVVPYAAGGATDVRARVVAEEMSRQLGQNVLVDNRSGGATLIGIQSVLQAPADGYTVIFHATPIALLPLTHADPGYAFEDFALIAPVGVAPHVLAVNPDTPGDTLEELVEYARANPGALNAGSLGGGGTSHLLTERFMDAAGIELTEVRYTGAGPALAAVMSGEIDLFMDSLSTSVPAAAEGRVKLLGVTSAERVESAPDIPTFAEHGFDTAVGGTWMAMFVRADTPEDIRMTLREAAVAAVRSDAVRDRIGVLGFELWSGTAEEFDAFMRNDYDLWEADIRRIGLTPQ